MDDGDNSSVNSVASKGRGRPRIIESWTRVISMEDDDLKANHKYPLNTDLMMNHNLPKNIDLDDG